MSGWDALNPWTIRVYIVAIVVIALMSVTIALVLYDLLLLGGEMVELLDSLDSTLEGVQ